MTFLAHTVALYCVFCNTVLYIWNLSNVYRCICLSISSEKYLSCKCYSFPENYKHFDSFMVWWTLYKGTAVHLYTTKIFYFWHRWIHLMRMASWRGVGMESMVMVWHPTSGPAVCAFWRSTSRMATNQSDTDSVGSSLPSSPLVFLFFIFSFITVQYMFRKNIG